MKITVFTDGSSRGNPGPGGWGSVIVAGGKAGESSVADARVIELGGGEKLTTNNRMEIAAAVEALGAIAKEFAKEAVVEVAIHTDSSYLINGITKWVRGWQAKGWVTAAKDEVQNRDLWEALISVVAKIDAKISWKYVGGHVGIAGNERCDEIATGFADSILKNDPSFKPTLYHGTLADYLVSNILDISIDTEAIKKKSAEKSEKNSRSKAKAYSYVSEVDGKVMVHYSWAECEARVKGKRARFKKALSPGEERAISAEFSNK